FCDPGEGGRFIDEGGPFINGRLPVNSSGGILSSNPYTAAGLVRLGEAALQIMGRAKGHQIANVNIALAHGMTGMRDQGNCVFILSKE
ncbi:MAG: thiolase family protein, partial [Candidatus Helarchaeota archaeon]|nr:thiolase family protein [Candidatus Helarchaeota archaeon]